MFAQNRKMRKRDFTILSELPLYKIFDNKSQFLNAFNSSIELIEGVLQSPVLIWSNDAIYSSVQDKSLGDFFTENLELSLPYLKTRLYLLEAILNIEKYAKVFLHGFLSHPKYIEQYPELIHFIINLPVSVWSAVHAENGSTITPLMRLCDSPEMLVAAEESPLLVSKMCAFSDDYWSDIHVNLEQRTKKSCLAALLTNKSAVPFLRKNEILLKRIMKLPNLAWETPSHHSITGKKKYSALFLAFINRELIEFFLNTSFCVEKLAKLSNEAWIQKHFFAKKTSSCFFEFFGVPISGFISEYQLLIDKMLSFSDEGWRFFSTNSSIKMGCNVLNFFILRDGINNFALLKAFPALADRIALLPDDIWLRINTNGISPFISAACSTHAKDMLETHPVLVERFLKFSDKDWEEQTEKLPESDIDAIITATFSSKLKILMLSEKTPGVILKRILTLSYKKFAELLEKNSDSLFYQFSSFGRSASGFSEYSIFFGMMTETPPYHISSFLDLFRKIAQACPDVWGIEASSPLFGDPSDKDFKEVDLAELQDSNNTTRQLAKARLYLSATPLHLASQSSHILILEDPGILQHLVTLPTEKWEQLARAGIFAGTSPLYGICSHERGQLLFNKEPLLLEHLQKMSPTSWTAQKKQGEDKGASCLFMLLRHKVGRDLLKNNLELWKTISALSMNAWSAVIEEGPDRETSPLYWLCREAPELLINSTSFFRRLSNHLPSTAWQTALTEGPLTGKTAAHFLGEFSRKTLEAPAPTPGNVGLAYTG